MRTVDSPAAKAPGMNTKVSNIVRILIIAHLMLCPLPHSQRTICPYQELGRHDHHNESVGGIPRLKTSLSSPSIATVSGAAMDTSTTTSYIESASGVKAGGRTGLTAVVVAILFRCSLFFAPLATTIPDYATAPALPFVACIMVRDLAEVDWENVTEYVPAVVTALAMPLTFSVANSIVFGFITYAAIKLLSGRSSELNPAVAILAIAFIAKFAFL